MKTGKRRIGRAFTIIELTIAMSLGMAVAAMIIALFNQQLAFLRMYRTQSFLMEEAPLISLHVSKLVGRAERFRLHASLEDALNGDNPRSDASPVVVLNYRQPDGTVRAALLAFHDIGEGEALYYYIVPSSGPLGDPQWYISNKAANIEFVLDEGVLRMVITGPEGEEVTYSGTMQL
ncbi:MAG: hypothetical protein ACQCXQ_02075 [Verrucomicrobiales bacterium]|nr:hypothetical protein [Verrucomicrobiota bacterium JB025]